VCLGLCSAGASWAQTGPVKLIVGFPPDGSADALARAVTDKLLAALGVPVIVETKAGAGGRIATGLKQAEFATMIAADKARWTPVVAYSKFKAS
jgi:tripartite-type tricarboxylate transporter receptor subunit TctC